MDWEADRRAWRRNRCTERFGCDLRSSSLAEPRPEVAARRRRRVLDRRVVLLRMARQQPAPAGPAARGGEGRALGRAWRRLLPEPEVPGGPAADARTPALVQMGSLHHLDFRLS